MSTRTSNTFPLVHIEFDTGATIEYQAYTLSVECQFES